jgi:hypothetical protein
LEDFVGMMLKNSKFPVLGKMPLLKKAHEKTHVHRAEQSLVAGPNCQAGWGKDGAAPSLGEQWLL